MLKATQSALEIREASAPGPSLEPYRREIVSEPGAGWDRLTAGFADMCLEQTMAFAGARFGAERSTGIILRAAEGGEPVAMALAVVATLPVLGLGLAYVKFGPLWRRRGASADASHLGLMLAALKREFAERRGLAVRIMPPADPGHEDGWKRALAGANFTFHAAASDRERYLVDLTLSEGEQLKSLGSKWRYNLAKSAIDDLDIHEASLEDGLPEFLGLYREMLTRKQFADRHGVEDLPAIARAAGSALGMRLFFASHGGRPVIGSIIVGTGERVFVPFSASSEKALELRAGYALRWTIMERLRGTEARWLDLGGTEGDEGLRHYKLGNVGKRGRVAEIPGEFDFAPSALAAGAARVVLLGREIARSREMKRIATMLPV
ncbi:MAG TPA: GNAT family N-acetyltransferase [Xanthobacteraceae bacterium]|nr:GNAT family N-acetyltransferase [Xanthobacteraceae bacterium]